MEEKIKNLINLANKVALFGHKNPDGDCIGSIFGFGKLLEKMEKNVSFFTPTMPSKIYDFLPEIKKISDNFDYGDYDLLVFLDFSDYTRILPFYEKNPDYFEQKNIVVFDHHVYENKHKNRNIISDPTSMSNCEIVFEYTFKRWPKLYDKDIATYFYLGLTTDSGNFRYDEDHKRVLKNALELVQLGADKKFVVNNAFRRKSLNGVKMMERMFQRLVKKGDLIYSRYTPKDLEELNIDREEADFGQVIIQDIDEARVSVIFRSDETDKNFSMSFRSKNVDVQKIAKKFGGGGHIHAAGCTIPREGSLQEQIINLSQKISDII